MVKKFLTFLLAVTAVVLQARGDCNTPMKALNAPPNAVRLTEKQIKTIRAVQPWMGKNETATCHKTFSRLASLGKINAPFGIPRRVNSSGSRIQGYRTSDIWSQLPSGWYDLNFDGTENLLWQYNDPDWVDDGLSDKPDFPFTSGFMRDGKVYGFYGEMVLFWLIWGHGIFTLDGTIEEYHEYGNDFDVTDFSSYVISSAYDPESDKAYVYTLNSDASGYMLQTVNLDSYKFTVIDNDVKIEDILIGLTYNPADKQLYGMTPDARFVTLDKNTGQLTQKAKYSFTVSTIVEGLVYSPLDKCFVFVYSDGGGSSELYTIDAGAFSLDKCADLIDCEQYRILVTPDKIVDPKTPRVPEIISLDFPQGSLSGSATIKTPDKRFDGTQLTGTLKVIANVDGELVTESTATPGTSTRVSIENVSEGKHTFSFSVTQNELESSSVECVKYIGFDIPDYPVNIQLEEGLLTWDPVTTGINDGYIDIENLTYNVYLDDEKLNTDPLKECRYKFEMPDGLFSKHVAYVEAVNHDHVSDRGVSNDLKHGRPFPLPFSMAPTRAQSELITTRETNNPYLAWEFQQGAFACLTQDYESFRDEWFFLPGVIIPETDNLIEISFDAAASDYYNEPLENISVIYGSSQDYESATTVKSFDKITNTEYQRFTVWCKPDAGTAYFGFVTRSHEDGYQIKLKNINLSVSDRPVTIPTTVTELSATAAPKGELKATVSFKLPVNDASGKPLDNDQPLSVTVISPVKTQTLTGIPGTSVKTEIDTTDGINTIEVYASNSNDGLKETVDVFTGIDIPAPLERIRVSHTEDFKGLHFEWDAPTTGVHGGYIDPETVTYALCIYDENEYMWVIDHELGTERQCDYYPPASQGMYFAKAGIMTANQKGTSEYLLTAGSTVGKPFELPIIENFNEDGDGGYSEYCNLIIEDLPDETYMNNRWGYLFYASSWVGQTPPSGIGAFVCRGLPEKKARMILPAFSTEDKLQTGIEMPLWAGPNAAEIKVYACAYGVPDELIGSLYDPDNEGWVKTRFMLPEKFMNKKWVELKVDAVFRSEDETAALGEFKIKGFFTDDCSISDIFAPAFPEVGIPIEINATVENTGLQTCGSPAVELIVTRGEETISSLAMKRVDDSGNLQQMTEARYNTSWIPDAESVGHITFTAKLINPDMDLSNNQKSIDSHVARNNQPVVADLEAYDNGSTVQLTWTDPAVETGFESFENLAPFSFGDCLGDFKTINADGEKSNFFSDFRFPYDIQTKAWQVLSEREMTELMATADIDNDYVHACTGDHVLASFTPFSLYAGSGLHSDRWLISPEIKGGSEFSFMMSPAIPGYLETVEILYSTSDDNPEKFQSIEIHRLLTAEWRKYTYTLPDDARYFAIRNISETGEGFFVMIDDINYSPAAESPRLEGYDIYRNGTLVSEAANVRGQWTDKEVQNANILTYNIKPIVNHNGIITRGLISNTATVTMSGIETPGFAKRSIRSNDGFIIVTGYDGATISVYTIDGREIGHYQNAAAVEYLPARPGIYIVSADGDAAKVIVK